MRARRIPRALPWAGLFLARWAGGETRPGAVGIPGTLRIHGAPECFANNLEMYYVAIALAHNTLLLAKFSRYNQRR